MNETNETKITRKNLAEASGMPQNAAASKTPGGGISDFNVNVVHPYSETHPNFGSFIYEAITGLWTFSVINKILLIENARKGGDGRMHRDRATPQRISRRAAHNCR